jgi:hypothetical protein
MAKVTFEIEVEAEEVSQVRDALKDIVQDFGFPEHVLGVVHEKGSTTEIGGGPRKTVDLPPAPPIGWEDFARAMGCDLDFDPDADDEEDDETDPCIVLPGQVVELGNGLVYQVFSIDATGRLILDVLEELVDDDNFLCPPPVRH